MTPPMTDVAAICAGLTVAQRAGLVDGWRSPAGVMQVSVACSGRPLDALENAGLVNGALGLTPLGLAVRSALMKDKAL